eukprot:XP_011682567.1 PREDICTED: uncharacterized protein LOC105446880 [Strongylocentrotus purpuratus]
MGSYLWIRFTSNERNRFKGFQALLNAKIPVCLRIKKPNHFPTYILTSLKPSGVIGLGRNVTSKPGTTGPTSIASSTATSSASSTVKTGLNLVPILISTLASLSAIAIIALFLWLVCRRKGLKQGISNCIAAFVKPVDSPGMRDNPTFASSNVQDLRMSDVADCHEGNDPYMALTTPHDGPTFQVYEPLREVNSQGDGYEVPINGTN